MALTNEQITAQNFKSFYNQIRPYLNGNVPTFANTFNRSDLYSTDEQLIGRWIDGKPIYQKSIIASNPVVGNNTIPHNITNLDRVVKCDGTVMRNGDNFTFSLPICYVPNVTQWSIATSGISKSTVNITVGDGFTGTYALSDLVITLQYTKTTDGSISITDGNEYSLDEQVVGRWIDGKPLYQKTVIMTMPTLSTKYAITPISDCDILFVVWAFEYSSNATMNMYPAYGNDAKLHGSVWTTDSHHADGGRIILQADDNAWAGVPVYITVQYTKTTD